MEFIHDNFLLETEQAVRLYHDFAASLPIIDYHCHLSPRDIAENKRFENLTQIWLYGDHYKWRAMRTCGVDERFITGNASDWEKFEQWAAIVPKTLRNPLFHWTHLELKRPFGISDRLLNSSTAKSIWEECNAKLALPGFTTRGIQQQMNVEIICTTDDPVDSLDYHKILAADASFPVKVYPAFRPDKAMAFENVSAFLVYLSQLEEAADREVITFKDFLAALRNRHDYFHAHGARVSDHGLETIYAEEYSETEIQVLFAKVLQGKPLAPSEVVKLKSAVLYECALMDCEKGWVQQFHLGALRNTNSRMARTLGPDTGFDSIGDFTIAQPMAKFLNRLDDGNTLAKTILYNLNPRDNELFATMIGNFQDGSVAGKIQFGSAWWFLDQMDGMTKQIDALSNMGLLSQFIGMLTDSRSFLSYPRHEYFRRLLCNILGAEMKSGLLPNDIQLIGSMVQDISYNNAKRYFPFAKFTTANGAHATKKPETKEAALS
ncbi:MAG: glucuronate isomerase [Bacteroidetes bacterium]|nr:glucuronate isomerase [Bacteroidota bacterium]MCW5894122.1 glucuronate isomerase [Bacteroidota bacterium]